MPVASDQADGVLDGLEVVAGLRLGCGFIDRSGLFLLNNHPPLPLSQFISIIPVGCVDSHSYQGLPFQ